MEDGRRRQDYRFPPFPPFFFDFFSFGNIDLEHKIWFQAKVLGLSTQHRIPRWNPQAVRFTLVLYLPLGDAAAFLRHTSNIAELRRSGHSQHMVSATATQA